MISVAVVGYGYWGPNIVRNVMERQMHKENGQIVETPVEARAGFLDRPVLIVLILSTAAVIAGFIAV